MFFKGFWRNSTKAYFYSIFAHVLYETSFENNKLCELFRIISNVYSFTHWYNVLNIDIALSNFLKIKDTLRTFQPENHWNLRTAQPEKYFAGPYKIKRVYFSELMQSPAHLEEEDAFYHSAAWPLRNASPRNFILEWAILFWT